MQQSELILLVLKSTIGKSCAVWESLCKQRIYRKLPRNFSGTVLDCSQMSWRMQVTNPAFPCTKALCLQCVPDKGHSKVTWAHCCPQNTWLPTLKTSNEYLVSVVLGCLTASKTGITFLLFETENVTVYGQRHCCFPMFPPARCCWYSCLAAAELGE